MVSEQIQNYVNLVGGLTKATKTKATEAAQGLLSATHLDEVASGASGKVSNLAEEILAASRANRELFAKTISAEVDKAASRLGFARTEDLEAVREEIAELRAALVEQAARAEAAQAAARKTATAKKSSAARTTTAKRAAKKTSASKTAASKPATSKSAARKTAAEKPAAAAPPAAETAEATPE